MQATRSERSQSGALLATSDRCHVSYHDVVQMSWDVRKRPWKSSDTERSEWDHIWEHTKCTSSKQFRSLPHVSRGARSRHSQV